MLSLRFFLRDLAKQRTFLFDGLEKRVLINKKNYDIDRISRDRTRLKDEKRLTRIY